MDIAVTWNNATGTGTWSAANGDLVAGPALWSAVEVSLFSDGAWWGNAYLSQPIGSTLLSLRQAVKAGGTNIPLQAKNICTAALQWMIDAGIAATVTVVCAWTGPQAIGINVAITQATGGTVTRTYAFAWLELPGS